MNNEGRLGESIVCLHRMTRSGRKPALCRLSQEFVANADEGTGLAAVDDIIEAV